MKAALPLLLIATLLSRTLGQLDKVFVDGHVLFRGQDAWYHLRLADYLRVNWPHLLREDWFANPLGQPPVGWPPVTTYVLGLPFLSEHQMEVWAAILPPLVAVICVVVVYFIGLELLKSRWFALAAAGVFALLPTEFFHRTMLGFTDHHMFEVLFASLSLLFTLKIRRGKRWYVPLGLSLGLMFWTWDGAALVVLTLLAGTIITYLVDEEHFSPVGFAYASVIAALMFVPYAPRSTSLVPSLIGLVAGMVVPIILIATRSLVSRRGVFLLIVGALGAAALVGLSRVVNLLDIASGVFSFGSTDIVSEMSASTFTSLFSNFGLFLFFAMGALVFYLKEKEYVSVVFFVVTFVATLCHVRYGYYFAIPLGIMVAYGLQQTTSKVRNGKVAASLLVAMLFLISLSNTIRLATYELDISNDMYDALVWMRENTPSPYEDPNAFYEQLDSNAGYLTLTLWDYNHWLIYIGRRSPCTNAFGYLYPDIMQFFVTGQDPSPYIQELYGRDIPIRYLVVDRNMLESNWITWVTGWKYHPYLDNLYEGRLAQWKIIYANEEVKILEW